MDDKIGTIWDKHWAHVENLETFIEIGKSADKWTEHHLPLIDRLLSEMAKGGLFLEAGCGLGQWCFYARKKYGARALGVDIAAETMAKMRRYVAAKQIQGVEFARDDLTATTLPENYCDLFISLGVIEHFADSGPILKGMYKITKPGKRGLITVPNVFSLHTFSRPLAKILGKWTIGYEKSFSPRGLRKACERTGFKVVECGVIPSGEMFGASLNNLPFVGKLFERLSYAIEKRQHTLGFIAYVIVEK
jgi:SAM-dependent methyltransferase